MLLVQGFWVFCKPRNPKDNVKGKAATVEGVIDGVESRLCRSHTGSINGEFKAVFQALKGIYEGLDSLSEGSHDGGM